MISFGMVWAGELMGAWSDLEREGWILTPYKILTIGQG